MSIKFRFDLWISYLKIFCWAFLTNQEASWPFQRSCHLLLPKVTTRWRFLAKFSVRGTKSPVTINRPSPNPFSLRIEYFLQNFFVNSAQIWRFCSFSIIASFGYHSKKTAKIKLKWTWSLTSRKNFFNSNTGGIRYYFLWRLVSVETIWFHFPYYDLFRPF